MSELKEVKLVSVGIVQFLMILLVREALNENVLLVGMAIGGGGGVVTGVPVGRTQRPAPGVALSGAHQDWATEVGEGRWVCWWGAQNAVPAQRPLKRIVCCRSPLNWELNCFNWYCGG